MKQAPVFQEFIEELEDLPAIFFTSSSRREVVLKNMIGHDHADSLIGLDSNDPVFRKDILRLDLDDDPPQALELFGLEGDAFKDDPLMPL